MIYVSPTLPFSLASPSPAAVEYYSTPPVPFARWNGSFRSALKMEFPAHNGRFAAFDIPFAGESGRQHFRFRYTQFAPVVLHHIHKTSLQRNVYMRLPVLSFYQANFYLPHFETEYGGNKYFVYTHSVWIEIAHFQNQNSESNEPHFLFNGWKWKGRRLFGKAASKWRNV